MNKSAYASVKSNNEDEYADMVIPIDPDDFGNVSDAEVGVKFKPVLSGAIDDDNVA